MISTTISREVANVKIDSKGRILLPPGVREEFDLEPGRRVSVRKTKQGLMVLAARNRGGRSHEAEYFARLKRVLETPPVRTGKPTNPSPEEMKKVWEPKV